MKKAQTILLVVTVIVMLMSLYYLKKTNEVMRKKTCIGCEMAKNNNAKIQEMSKIMADTAGLTAELSKQQYELGTIVLMMQEVNERQHNGGAI